MRTELRRSPDGELSTIDPDEDVHLCNGGFLLEEDHLGRPQPCPLCRRDLVDRLRAQRGRVRTGIPQHWQSITRSRL